MNKLLEAIGKCILISEELKLQLYEVVTDKRYKKKSFFIKAGKVDRHIWFIEKGLVIIYTETRDEIRVIYILKEVDFVIAPDSLSTGEPTDFNILVLEDTITWRTTRKKVIDTCDMYREFARGIG